MDIARSLYIFIVFKFAPTTIDSNSSKFWSSSVNLLNKLRDKTGGAFYLAKIGKLYIRDPHSFPMKSHWTSSEKHPFCWYIAK